MDLLPCLGEPGLLDDLFWFGPIALQLILGVVFFWLTGKWMKKEPRGRRVISTIGMVIVADLLLFAAFGIVFKMSTGL